MSSATKGGRVSFRASRPGPTRSCGGLTARIPRIEKGNVPGSAVPGGRIPSESGIEGAVDALQSGLQTGAKVFAAEQKKIQEARDKKQEWADELDAGRREEDYGDILRGFEKELQVQYADNPQSAVEAFKANADQVLDESVRTSTNDRVSLLLARRAGARREQAVAKMQGWADARLSQKMQDDLRGLVNRAAAGAEGLRSVGELNVYLSDFEERNAQRFDATSADPAKEMRQAKELVTEGFFRARTDDPDTALFAMKMLEDKGPAAEFLTPTQRKVFRSAAQEAWEGGRRRREMAAISEGLEDNPRLAEAYLNNDPNMGAALHARKTAIETQKALIEAQQVADAEELGKLGVPQGNTRDEVLKVLDDRLKFVNALDSARRRQIGPVAEDDPTSVKALLVTQAKAMKAASGRDMRLVVEQQANIAAELSDGRITPGMANALFKDLSLATTKAAAEEKDVTGPDRMQMPWLSPRDAGNVVINQAIGDDAGLRENEALQTRIRVQYIAQLVDAQEKKGAPLTREEAMKVATRVLSVETQQNLPGAE